MPYKLIISEKAQVHVKESINWYEIRKKGLGKLFYLSVTDTFKILLNNPFAYAIIHHKIRRILTKKFHHGVFYYIDEDKKEIHIIAILHTGRNPEEWKNISD